MHMMQLIQYGNGLMMLKVIILIGVGNIIQTILIDFILKLDIGDFGLMVKVIGIHNT